MKIFVVYDETGKIRGTFAAAKEHLGVRVAKNRAIHTFEDEGKEGEALKQYLSELHAKFRIAGSADVSRLEKITA